MEDHPYLGYLVRDIRLTIKAAKEAYPFVMRHRLWVGVLSYGWFSRFLLIVAFIVGLKFLGVILSWAGTVRTDSPVSYGASVLDLYGKLFKEGYHLFALGGLKYGILVLANVLLFHVVRRSMEILKGEKQDDSFKTFTKGQIRSIKVSLMAWAMEIGVTTLASAALGLMHSQWLQSPLNWCIQCFFLGFVVMDSYFEHFGVTIKQSALLARQTAGVALVVGIITYLLLGIPVAGAIIGPFFACIAATLTLFEMEAKNLLPPTTQPPNHPIT